MLGIERTWQVGGRPARPAGNSQYRMRVASLPLGVVTVVFVMVMAMTAGVPRAWASMWTVQTTFNGSSFDNELNSSAQAANGQAWAVGTVLNDATGWKDTLIEHNPGGSGSWTQQTSPPGISEEDNVLQGVRVRSAGNVWAVGWSDKTLSDGSIDPSTLAPIVAHFNGSSWKNVNLPSNVSGKYQLFAIGAPANNDIWAVGSSGKVIRFNGSTWIDHSIPNGDQFTLLGVVAFSPTDAWVAGWALVGLGSSSAVLEHWNGSSWTSFHTGNFDTERYSDVGGLSTHNVWAVGYDDATDATRGGVLAHWDGSTWTRLTTPGKGQSASTDFFSVRPISTTDVIAVGNYREAASPHTERTLIEHYNGSTVSIESSPNLGSGDNELRAISGESVIHAVGVGGASAFPKTLAMVCTTC